ncbi:Gti1/Pac2 family-domain-containing protein [Xylariaceae sp. AK1471]|nr:Gti1/Pac2 family-domain-containing protein [Xylariaceae sp. AK1471]
MMGDRSSNSPLTPTFNGFISSTMDALILFEACLSGRIVHVPRRPHDRERAHLIRSGNIFIYEEHSSGIKRWTDGVPWSPSRILGNFLLYRELDKPFQPGEKKRAMKRNKTDGGVNKPTTNTRSHSMSSFGSAALPSPTAPSAMDNAINDADRAYIGSLVDSYQFKENGLVKKTISVQYRGVQHHLVSYYNLEDIKSQQLRTPSESAEMVGIVPRPALISSGNFRSPVDDNDFAMVDPTARLFYAPGIDYAPVNGTVSRSLSIPSAQVYGHPPAWNNPSHYTPSPTFTSPTYTMSQTLPPPPTANYSHGQHLVSPYSYESTYGSSSSRPPSYNSMVSTTRRQSAVPSTNGTSQVGYSAMSSTDRGHLNSAALIADGGGLSAHGLSSSSYMNGDMFGTSAAEAAAESASTGNAGGYSVSHSNGTHNMGSSAHHTTAGYDGHLSNGFNSSMGRLALSGFEVGLQESAGSNFVSASTGTTPTDIPLGMDAEPSSAGHDWSSVGTTHIHKREDGSSW